MGARVRDRRAEADADPLTATRRPSSVMPVGGLLRCVAAVLIVASAVAGGEVAVGGAKSPPAKAYARYYRALLSGDLETVKKLVLPAAWKSFEGEDPATVAELAELVKPPQPQITSVKTSGNRATLHVEGEKDGQKLSGVVRMVEQGGEWRVESDDWKEPEPR
jgi:hypothetical protein